MRSNSRELNILALSLDERLFEEGSGARERMRHYGEIFSSLHIMVFTRSRRRADRIAKNVLLYPLPASFSLRGLLKAVRVGSWILAGIKPNTVITSQDAFANVVAFILKYRHRLPLRVEIHTDFLSPFFRRESLKNRIRYHLYGWSVKHADCIRVVSQRIRDSLHAKYEIPKSKITVLPVFADVSRIGVATPNIDIRRSYPRFHPLILVVARLTREKNVGLAIEIFSRILKDFPQALLIVVGDGPERRTIALKVQELKLSPQVRLVGWQPSVMPYYRACDALLVTSRYEGYGRMLVEAAAAGLPIVATPVGLVGEVLRAGESVLTFRTRQEGIRALEQVLRNRELRDHLARAAREAVARLPDLPNYLERYRASLLDCGRVP